MGRLKTAAPRLSPAQRALRSAPSGEAARLAAREKARPNWYQSKRWRKLRREVLARDGYTCRQTGVALVGKHPAPNSPVVDHIEAHRWDEARFWDPANLQAVSKAWHDREKQRMERRALP